MGLAFFFIAPGLKTPFHVDLSALGKVSFTVFRHSSEYDDPVPFGLLLLFPGSFVRPLFAGGNGEIDHCGSLLCVPDFRVPAQVADDDCFVDSGHLYSCSFVFVVDPSEVLPEYRAGVKPRPENPFSSGRILKDERFLLKKDIFCVFFLTQRKFPV
jgi:hypothetical protein